MRNIRRRLGVDRMGIAVSLEKVNKSMEQREMLIRVYKL